jgi:hypothetical protein
MRRIMRARLVLSSALQAGRRHAANVMEGGGEVVDPLQGAVVTKYLVRIWPADDQPPEMQESEMCSPESVAEGQPGNDRAEIHSIRQWAQSHANVERIPYSFEVRRDSIVAALASTSTSTGRRVVELIASGTVEPSRPAQ